MPIRMAAIQYTWPVNAKKMAAAPLALMAGVMLILLGLTGLGTAVKLAAARRESSRQSMDKG